MKKILTFSYVIFLCVHAILANTATPGKEVIYSVSNAKVPLRFKSYASYSKYLQIRIFQGIDSAKAFYMKESEDMAISYTDPWLLLTGGTLTGALGGTSANFSGNVGIGTTSPSVLLDVRGSVAFNQGGASANFTMGAVSNANAFVINGTRYGRIGIGSDVSAGATVQIGGVFDSYFGSGELEAVNIVSNVQPFNGDGSLLRLAGTLTKASYGSHTNFSGLKILPPSIVSGGSSLDNASSLYITGAPTGATNNYALRIEAGMVALGTGNIGIGTASPAANLDVRGSAAFNQGGANVSLTVGAVSNANALVVNGGHNGRLGIGTDVSNQAAVKIGGTFDSYYGGGELEAVDINSNVQPSYGDGSLLRLSGTLTKSSSGSHTNFSGLKILPPTIVAGSASLDNASSLYISGAPSGATNNYAFRVESGTISLGSGNVGIGTSLPTEKLSVNGNVSAKKLIVTQIGWSDYVFATNYKLRSLHSLEAFITKYKHLPEVPTVKEVEEKGISIGDNQALLLKKIEELTLYVIDLQKQVNDLKNKK